MMTLELTDKDTARFWDKVDKSGDCWLWTSQLRGGYGLFRLNGKIVGAHRVSYALENDIVENLQVLHSCGTPACVNPEHLFQGTVKINSDDKMVKDRHNFTLTNEQVEDIRARPVTITMCRDLAEEFGVTPALIKNVLTGQSYGWLPGAREIPPQFTGHKITPEALSDILEVLSHAKWGDQTKLAKKYGVSVGIINSISKNRPKYTTTDTQ